MTGIAGEVIGGLIAILIAGWLRAGRSDVDQAGWSPAVAMGFILLFVAALVAAILYVFIYLEIGAPPWID